MSAPKPPRSGRRITFDQFLDRRLADAQALHGVMAKLWRIYRLNDETLRLCVETEAEPDFDKLTVLAPPVDPFDPLGLLGRLDAAAPGVHRADDDQPPSTDPPP